jgi:hypothetical protein
VAQAADIQLRFKKRTGTDLELEVVSNPRLLPQADAILSPTSAAVAAFGKFTLYVWSFPVDPSALQQAEGPDDDGIYWRLDPPELQYPARWFAYLPIGNVELAWISSERVVDGATQRLIATARAVTNGSFDSNEEEPL